MSANNHLNVAGRVDEFDRRNGRGAVMYNDWFFYANGAMRELMAIGVMIDPPEDDFQRLTNILRYHQARHAIAVREFDNLKNELLMAGHPDGEAVDRLKKLQLVVGERNQAVNDARSKLAATEHGKQLERNRRTDAEYREQQNAFKNSVREIRI
jgi:hypothetical protein